MSTSPTTIQGWVIDTDTDTDTDTDIDIDTDVTEPGDLFTSRLPAKYQDDAPRIVRDPETQIETWLIGGRM